MLAVFIYCNAFSTFSRDGQNIAQNFTTLSCGVKLELWCQRSTGLQLAIRRSSATILCKEAEIAVASLKKGKSAGADKIPAERVQAGGETIIAF